MEITETQLEFLKGNLNIKKCNIEDLEIGSEKDNTKYFQNNKLNIRYTETYFRFGTAKAYMINNDNKTILILHDFAEYGNELYIRGDDDKFIGINLDNQNLEDVLNKYNVKVLKESEV